MKKILLLGDSIRCGSNGNGYDYYVKEKLKDKAEVFFPTENCRFAQYTLRYVHEWVEQLGIGAEVDVVHWNNGLWDVLRLLGDDPLTPPEMYKYMIKKIYDRLCFLFPTAKIIFALTTPVIESLGAPDFMRYNSEIERYNEYAKVALLGCEVTFNDLYSVAQGVQPLHNKDWVHYSDEGSSLLADAVILALKPYLK